MGTGFNTGEAPTSFAYVPSARRGSGSPLGATQRELSLILPFCGGLPDLARYLVVRP
jgi:hypothetical protein